MRDRPSPAASIRITAAMIGEPNRNETAAKVPELASSVPSCGGASRRIDLDHEKPETAAQRDQGRLRPNHEAEADRGDGREQHARGGRLAGWARR